MSAPVGTFTEFEDVVVVVTVVIEPEEVVIRYPSKVDKLVSMEVVGGAIVVRGVSIDRNYSRTNGLLVIGKNLM
jgi:hypothetical protein